MSLGSRSTRRCLLYCCLSLKSELVRKWSNYTKLSRSDVVYELVLTHSPPAGHSMVMQFRVSPGNCVCKLPLWANKAVNCVTGRAESV